MSKADLAVKISPLVYGCCLPLCIPDFSRRWIEQRVFQKICTLNAASRDYLFHKIKQYILVLFIGAIQKIIIAIYMSISAAYQATVLVMLSTFYTEMTQNYSNKDPSLPFVNLR